MVARVCASCSRRSKKISLELQGCNVQEWDPILIHILTGKLDPETRKQWELTLKGTDLPELKELVEFLDTRAKALENAGPTGTRDVPHQQQTQSSYTRQAAFKTFAGITDQEKPKCPACKTQYHPLFRCSVFQKKDQNERRDLVMAAHLCYNCLMPNHGVVNCPSTSTCKTCDKKT